MSSKLKTAILAAASWLEANPSRHIKGRIAVDAEGKDCEPIDPKAECFCAAGRVMKELNFDTENAKRGYGKIREEILEPVELEMYHFYGPNDSAEPWGDVTPFCPKEVLSGPHAIAAMRSLADGLDTE